MLALWTGHSEASGLGGMRIPRYKLVGLLIGAPGIYIAKDLIRGLLVFIVLTRGFRPAMPGPWTTLSKRRSAHRRSVGALISAFAYWVVADADDHAIRSGPVNDH